MYRMDTCIVLRFAIPLSCGLCKGGMSAYVFVHIYADCIVFTCT